MSTFDVILADPCWRYSFSRSKNRRVENHYPTMTTEQIAGMGFDLPIAENAVLFLWATAPKLEDALYVMRAWNCTYKTHAVWDKQRIGMGFWFRGHHELLLVGTRGKPKLPAPADRVASIFTEKRGRHSAKPACVHEWIERAFTSASKLELFARVKRVGWECRGLEVDGQVEGAHECL